VYSLAAPGTVGKRVIAGLILLLGIGLMYCAVSGRLSSRASGLASGAYVGLIVVIFRHLYPQYRGLLARRYRPLDLAKATAWFVASLLWIAIAIGFVSDTRLGATMLLVPSLIMLGTSTILFLRGLGFFDEHRNGSSDDV
jgi:hypothetical protein